MISQIDEVPSHSEDGQAMVEYALVIILLVVAVATLSFGGVVNSLTQLYQYILDAVSSV